MRLRPVFGCLFAVLLAAPGGCARRSDGHGGSGHGLGDPKTRLNAAGETPGWSALVRPGLLRLELGDATALQVKPDFTDLDKGGGRWSGPLPNNAGALSLEVSAKPCHDSETGLAYPLSAVVLVQGHRYAGCAAPPGQGLGPRV